jgi:truncated hemoglobin YjbI
MGYFFRTMLGGSLFEQMGGERVLRDVVSRFVDRMFADVMIGFMFRRANRDRIKAKEYEFAAGHLGAVVRYTGRALVEAHAPHVINGGQFNRRVQLLEETLNEMEVPPHVRSHWVRVTQQLRKQIVTMPDTSCPPPASAAPAGPTEDETKAGDP